MKKLILLMVAVMSVSLTASASKMQPSGGDDLFPWPWGTECPFPWAEIEGTYQVRTLTDGDFNGHFLIFSVDGQNDNGTKFLNVFEYDRQGVHFASGQAYSQKDQRILKGVMATSSTGEQYVLMVRSYVKDAPNSRQVSCRGAELVTAVTFCPIRGRKCKDTNNYVLQKVE